MQIGVVLDILWPLERIERLARAAEESGFDQVWVSDHPLGHDPFLTVAHLAASLPRVRFGIGTINPSARHPAVIAASSGFLNHLIAGRFSLGIGSSIDALLNPIGLDVRGQVSRCREAVYIVRQLLESGRSSLEGAQFRTIDARARFHGVSPLPILIGASGGPAMLKMGGEVADGVIIPAGNRSFYEYAIKRFRDSHEVAGHPGKGVVIVNGNVAVSEDPDAAFERSVVVWVIRPLVADAIAHRAENRHSLQHMGIDLGQARAWRESPDSLPDSVVRESGSIVVKAGTPLTKFGRNNAWRGAQKGPQGRWQLCEEALEKHNRHYPSSLSDSTDGEEATAQKYECRYLSVGETGLRRRRYLHRIQSLNRGCEPGP